MTSKLKKQESIGCCGIDCGLCPRFHTKSSSGCPGCGGVNFNEKHPSCGFLTCCAIKHHFEVCSDCTDFPCQRFESEKSGYDSFVTHKKVFSNLNDIKNKGIDPFIAQQKARIDLLTYLLNNFDDGRSKSFFCLGCALLPSDQLNEIHQLSKEQLLTEPDVKMRNKQVRALFNATADTLGIQLTLVKK